MKSFFEMSGVQPTPTPTQSAQPQMPNDPDFMQIMKYWQTLPQPVKNQIRTAMANGVKQSLATKPPQPAPMQPAQPAQPGVREFTEGFWDYIKGAANQAYDNNLANINKFWYLIPKDVKLKIGRIAAQASRAADPWAMHAPRKPAEQGTTAAAGDAFDSKGGPTTPTTPGSSGGDPFPTSTTTNTSPGNATSTNTTSPQTDADDFWSAGARTSPTPPPTTQPETGGARSHAAGYGASSVKASRPFSGTAPDVASNPATSPWWNFAKGGGAASSPPSGSTDSGGTWSKFVKGVGKGVRRAAGAP